MRQVFLSSTARDLQEYRNAVFEAIQKCDGWHVVRMEDFGARAEMTDEFCRAKVAECDLFVGIVGHYFGSSPKRSDKSYTQQEYNAAVETNRPRLMFVTPDDFSTPANLRESTKKYKLQQKFRERVKAQPCAFFSDAKDLATKVVTAIRNYEVAPDFATEEKRYLAQLIERTELLEFVGIPDPRQNAAIKLEDIFVPLGATEEDSLNSGPEQMLIAAVLNVPLKSVERETAKRPSSKMMRRVSLEDALRVQNRLMILGDPGAGKSTLLRYLALGAARSFDSALQTTRGSAQDASSPVPEKRLPILIPLRRFAASNQSLVEFFYAYANQTLQIELTRGLFEHALDDGQCLVLFDGLDEVFVSDQRVAVRDAVAAFANRYGHNNRIIVTSRIVGYESAPLDRRAFAHHTILPFTEKEIESFVHRWYAARERVPEQAKAQAEQLCKTIKDSDRLRKLAENPLMLTIIALVHRVEAELPNERVKLYDKCTESLLSTWEGVKGLAHDRERTYYKHRRRLLEKLAFWMHTQSQEAERQAEVKHGDLKAKLSAFLLEDPKLNLSVDLAELEADAFIELAKSRTGILVERGDGIYSFVHLTFQEYFAACDLEKRYITNLERLWRKIQPHLYDPRWREVILLLLGRLNEHDEPPSILVEKILREHDKFDEVLHRNLFLVAQCLADRVNVQDSLHQKIIDELLVLSIAQSPRYESLRTDAIKTLGTLGNDSYAANGLLGIAEDNEISVPVRIIASQALGKLGRIEDAIQILVEIVRDTKNGSWIRIDATRVLGQMGRAERSVIDFLSTLARSNDIEPSFLRVVAITLAQLGQKEEAGRLLWSLLQADLLWFNQFEIVQALAQLRLEDTLQLLRKLAQDRTKLTKLRVSASIGLGKLGRKNLACQFLIKLVKNENLDGEDKLEAGQALGQFNRPGDAVSLLRSLVYDKSIDNGYRIKAALALGQFGDTLSAIPYLVSIAIDNNSGHSRKESIEALDKLGQIDQRMIRFLLKMARDKNVDYSTKSTAVRTLAHSKHPLAADLLLRMVWDRKIEEWHRMESIKALTELGQRDTLVAVELLNLTREKNDYISNAAYQSLKEVVGNLRYTELDNGQKRIKRTDRKIPRPKSKNGNRKSKILNHK